MSINETKYLHPKQVRRMERQKPLDVAEIKDGKEVTDPNPLILDVTPLKAKSVRQLVQEAMRNGGKKQFDSLGEEEYETLDEAEDFDIDEDGSNFTTGYEVTDMDMQDIDSRQNSESVNLENDLPKKPDSEDDNLVVSKEPDTKRSDIDMKMTLGEYLDKKLKNLSPKEE